MTWWCRLFHQDWWYLARADSSLARLQCKNCGGIVIYELLTTAEMRNAASGVKAP